MAKTIAVCGATGQMGGSVAYRMLKEGWHVWAITRNTSSGKAKALVSAGAEVVTADYGDVDSLHKAFEGAHAVFAVTNAFERFMAVGREAACEEEYDQMMAVAMAARETGTLEHFILHTLPSGEKLAGKDHIVPHMDNKDKVADKIKASMPELAKKTTFLWIGLFPSNFYLFPMMKPAELPGSYGAYVWINPISGDTPMYISGDIEHNVGSFVKAILEKPDVSLPAKYAFVYTEVIPFKDMLLRWSEVTGRRAVYIQVGRKEYEGLWGDLYGTELAMQFEALEKEPDWTKAHKADVIGAKELGIPSSDLLDLKASLEKDKDKL